MADIKNVLFEEIRRLARKEVKSAVAPLNSKIAELKKHISALSKELKSANSVHSKKNVVVDELDAGGDAQKSVRLNAAGIKKVRLKLGLSQASFAKILQVSTLSVSGWELGKASPRAEAKKRIAAMRHIGKKEFAALCEESKISLEKPSRKPRGAKAAADSKSVGERKNAKPRGASKAVKVEEKKEAPVAFVAEPEKAEK